MPLAGSVQRRTAEALVQQALDAAARASKGFSLNLCTQARPQIGDLLAGPLQAAISIPQVGCTPAAYCHSPKEEVLACLQQLNCLTVYMLPVLWPGTLSE